MIESGRVPGKGRIHAIIEKLSEPVPKNGRIRVSTGNDKIRASTEKWYNPYESEKLSERVPKIGRMRVSTGNWKDSGEYREKVESVRVSKYCPKEYRKMVESGLVPENDRIWASIGKR